MTSEEMTQELLRIQNEYISLNQDLQELKGLDSVNPKDLIPHIGKVATLSINFNTLCISMQNELANSLVDLTKAIEASSGK